MATGTTPSGSAFVFKIPSGGREETTYAPSGYSAVYQDDKALNEILDWHDRKRREEMEDQFAIRREQRAQRAQDISEEREKRQEERDLHRSMLEDARAERIQSRQDLYEKRMDDLDKLSGVIDSVDPTHRDASKQLMDVRNTPEFHRLLANRDTRQALNEMFKSKTGEVKDVIDGIQHEASKYGVEADIDQLPYDKNGIYDFQKIYKEILPSLGMKKQQQISQEMEASRMRASAAGYEEVPITTPEGKTTIKLLKKEQQFGIPTGKPLTTEPSKPASLPPLAEFARQYKSLPPEFSEPVDSSPQ